MKTLILTQYYPPEMGAPQTRLSELAKGLVNLGGEVSIVTALPNYPKGEVFDKYKGKFSITEKEEGITIRRFWLYPSNSTNAIPRIFSMISFTLTCLFSLFFVRKFNPDYIFVESPPLTLGFSGWLLSKFSGSKFIFNISDLYPLSAKELGIINDGFLYKSIEALEKFLYNRAFAVTGQSSEIVKYIESRGAKKTILFRNGVDFSRFKSINANEKIDKTRIVYAGLLGFAQGISDICKNVKFDDIGVEFHIFGAGKDKEKIEKYILKNPNSNIYLHSVVEKSEIPAILKSFDGTLIPLKSNIYGAVPSKIYEAMAAGLPILYSGAGEAKEIIEKNDLGWVSPASDYGKLEQNINEFVQDKEKRELFAKNGIKTAKKVFNRKIQINNLHNFLSSNLEN